MRRAVTWPAVTNHILQPARMRVNIGVNHRDKLYNSCNPEQKGKGKAAFNPEN